MKIAIKILAIVLAVGIVLAAAGCIAVAATDGKLETIEESYAIAADGFVEIRSLTADVEVEVGEDDEIKLTCTKTDRVKPQIVKSEGMLSLQYPKSRTAIGWLTKKHSVKLVLPKSFSGKLDVQGTTGAVKMKLGGLELDGLIAGSTTGDLTVTDAKSSGHVKFATTTGNLYVKSVESGKNIDVNASTGKIDLINLVAADDVFVYNSTGAVNLDGVKAGGKITATNTTGGGSYDIDCKEVQIKSTTGAVKFKIKTATDVRIEVTTGDVNGVIFANERSFGNIDYSVTTGSCNLPKRSGDGGRLYVKTTTGDINVTFSE